MEHPSDNASGPRDHLPHDPLASQFRERLEYADMPPPPEVWDHIESTLDHKKRRAVWIWVPAAAVFLMGIMMGLLLPYMAPPTEPSAVYTDGSTQNPHPPFSPADVAAEFLNPASQGQTGTVQPGMPAEDQFASGGLPTNGFGADTDRSLTGVDSGSAVQNYLALFNAGPEIPHPTQSGAGSHHSANWVKQQTDMTDEASSLDAVITPLPVHRTERRRRACKPAFTDEPGSLPTPVVEAFRQATILKKNISNPSTSTEKPSTVEYAGIPLPERPHPETGQRWALAAHFQPQYVSQQYDFKPATPPTPTQPLVNLGPHTETTANHKKAPTTVNTEFIPTFSFDTGIEAMYAFGKGWQLGTGVQYAQYTAVDPAAPDAVDVPYSRDLSYFESNLKAQTESLQTLRFGSTATRTVDIQQTLHYAGIPVRIYYRVGSKRMSVQLNTGMIFNVFVRGDWQTSNEEPIEFTQYGTEVFEPVHLNGLVGAGIRYRLDETYSVMLEPTCRVSLTSMTNPDVVQSYPFALGVGLRLMVHGKSF